MKASSGERSVAELLLGAKSSYLNRPLHTDPGSRPQSLSSSLKVSLQTVPQSLLRIPSSGVKIYIPHERLAVTREDETMRDAFPLECHI